MPETSLIETQIDPAVKERAAAVFGELGMTVSEAVGIFLIRPAEQGALPFELADDPDEYDAWFRAQVQEALDDPRPPIPNEEVKAEFAKRRAALLNRVR